MYCSTFWTLPSPFKVMSSTVFFVGFVCQTFWCCSPENCFFFNHSLIFWMIAWLDRNLYLLISFPSLLWKYYSNIGCLKNLMSIWFFILCWNLLCWEAIRISSLVFLVFSIVWSRQFFFIFCFWNADGPKVFHVFIFIQGNLSPLFLLTISLSFLFFFLFLSF